MIESNNPKNLVVTPVIYCALSVSFGCELSASKFAVEICEITGCPPKIYSPKIGCEWIVDAVVAKQLRSWSLDEVLTILFFQIQTIKERIKLLITKYSGAVTIDIAVYNEDDTYPALFLSKDIVNEIAFFNAQIGIDLV